MEKGFGSLAYSMSKEPSYHDSDFQLEYFLNPFSLPTSRIRIKNWKEVT